MNKKYKFCFKKKKLVEYDLHDDKSCSYDEKREEKPSIQEVVFDGDRCSVPTKTGAICKDWNEYASDLPAELLSLNLTQQHHKELMIMFANILDHSKKMCTELVRKNCNANEAVFSNIDCGFEKIQNKLREIDSHPKLMKKIKNTRALSNLLKKRLV